MAWHEAARVGVCVCMCVCLTNPDLPLLLLLLLLSPYVCASVFEEDDSNEPDRKCNLHSGCAQQQSIKKSNTC